MSVSTFSIFSLFLGSLMERPERVADLQAAARATLANTQRATGGFDGARQTFNQAWRILEESGTNHPLERASSVWRPPIYIRMSGRPSSSSSGRSCGSGT
jgi:hypothetical protein